MKVLLDTNIWRYLIDSESQDRLYKIARQANVTIAVCPSVVIETLRLNDLKLRKRIIEIQTRDCWYRLMPDAYLQCEDVKKEMLRTHPNWALRSKNMTLYKNLRYDWVRSKGGFWSKVRENTEVVAARYDKDLSKLDLVREQSREMREQVRNGKTPMVSDSLRNMTGSWTMGDGTKLELDFWRVYAELIWLNELLPSEGIQNDTVFRQWVGCELDLDLIFPYHYKEYINFWAHEVTLDSVPREWLRAAIYALQADRKVTPGNPIDSAIGVHLVDVDFVASADKNFVSIINQCQKEAPFKMANAFLISGGKLGIDQLFEKIANKFIDQ